ncbi:MAG TPA: gluconokinase [Nocardioidaceae bacterium]|nr:gluconokinase [Nocardioidaceae bacterium]
MVQHSGPVHVVAMGVSATGKTLVGIDLADRLGFKFLEGDSLHPQANIDKMAAGIPLTDEDRWPWLRMCAKAVAECDADDVSTVLSCSALRRGYRDLLREAAREELFFVHLHAPFEVLEARMTKRTKHFMPTSLLQSQFDTLEPLGDDEVGVVVDVSPPIEVVVDEAEKAIRSRYLESSTER